MKREGEDIEREKELKNAVESALFDEIKNDTGRKQMENRQDLSITELISRIKFDISTIIRREFALIRIELSDKIKRMIVDAIMIVAGAIVLFLGIQVLIATAIIALSYVIPLWLSALIIGLVLFIAGGAGAVSGINRLKKTDWMPRNSLKLFKEDVSWLKRQVA